MTKILEIKNLCAGYKDGMDIVKDFSIDVHEGDIVGLFGTNGTGKSTICKAIMNMTSYRRGQIIFNGEDVSGLPTHELSEKGMAIMLQGGRIFPTLTVHENLKIAQGNNCVDVFEKISKFIPFISSKDFKNKHAGSLSGGEAHHLSLAMTLLSAPKLVILDEPTAGLDHVATIQFYKNIDRLKRELSLSIILVEHKQTNTLDLCTTVYNITDN